MKARSARSIALATALILTSTQAFSTPFTGTPNHRDMPCIYWGLEGGITLYACSPDSTCILAAHNGQIACQTQCSQPGPPSPTCLENCAIAASEAISRCPGAQFFYES